MTSGGDLIGATSSGGDLIGATSTTARSDTELLLARNAPAGRVFVSLAVDIGGESALVGAALVTGVQGRESRFSSEAKPASERLLGRDGAFLVGTGSRVALLEGTVSFLLSLLETEADAAGFALEFSVEDD